MFSFTWKIGPLNNVLMDQEMTWLRKSKILLYRLLKRNYFSSFHAVISTIPAVLCQWIRITMEREKSKETKKWNDKKKVVSKIMVCFLAQFAYLACFLLFFKGLCTICASLRIFGVLRNFFSWWEIKKLFSFILNGYLYDICISDDLVRLQRVFL